MKEFYCVETILSVLFAIYGKVVVSIFIINYYRGVRNDNKWLLANKHCLQGSQTDNLISIVFTILHSIKTVCYCLIATKNLEK